MLIVLPRVFRRYIAVLPSIHTCGHITHKCEGWRSCIIQDSFSLLSFVAFYDNLTSGKANFLTGVARQPRMSDFVLISAQHKNNVEKSIHRVRRDNPWLTVRTFTQCSYDGATPVSRMSGVRLLEGCHAPLLPTSESVCPELCQVAFSPFHLPKRFC